MISGSVIDINVGLKIVGIVPWSTRLAIVAFEIFKSRAGIKNDYLLAGTNFPGTVKRLDSNETGCFFWIQEETFLRSHVSRDGDPLLIFERVRAHFELTRYV